LAGALELVCRHAGQGSTSRYNKALGSGLAALH